METNNFFLAGTLLADAVSRLFPGSEGCSLLVKVNGNAESVPVKAYSNSCEDFHKVKGMLSGTPLKISGMIHTYRNAKGVWVTELVARQVTVPAAS